MRRTGVRLRAIAARWFGAATMERYIDPVLADLQAEYEDAVRRGRTWQSRWTWVRGQAAFFAAIVCYGGGQTMRMLKDLRADDRCALVRTGAWCVAIIIAGTLVLAAVPFLSFVEAGRPDAVKLAIYLVPQALPLSIPLGLTLGVIWGMGRSGVSLRSRVAVLLAAAALSAASFAILGWLAPSMNQAFRVAIVGTDVPKGAHELTLGELRRLLRPARNEWTWPPPDDTGRLALQYHRRWAIACAPFVLSFFALVMIGPGHRRGVLLAPASVAAIFGYYALMAAATLGFDRTLPAFVAAWAPNTAFLIVSVALMRAAALRPRTTARG